ncbi:ATP-binding protein [Pelagicoccus mobilis]|uniref:ATP-binding protein n=1 Tax=Pelagicoccus mobilis TaxID=415221 RepID=A0A934S5Q5_9BACT|nr:ATP-binding protein [Pelagicoccus mobilis]MBK1879879.1 ATP-binding protein [Pelagicoccus mobilis]
MLNRPRYLQAIEEGFESHPAVALSGPRQCGKTTLARIVAEGEDLCSFFDLESAVDRRRLESPEQALSPLKGLVVIDEIQRVPSLFETLRVLLDRPDQPARFLLLGSASPDLIRGVSESLAGRVALIDLVGFDLSETGSDSLHTLWQRGGFPRSFLSKSEKASSSWRQNFIRTFLERDIPQFGINIPAETLRRFWTMIAHYHGQVWNGAEFARSLGTSEPTAKRYLDTLANAYVIRVLPPWHENLKKRQLKSPKIYIRDSGILHSLLELEDKRDLLGHPKLGASWEGFAIEQILASFPSRSAYFWATHSGAELDLLIIHRGKRYGFEFKHSDAPGKTRSMNTALQDLSLDHLWVVYPGKQRYELTESISALPAEEIPQLAKKLAEG